MDKVQTPKVHPLMTLFFAAVAGAAVVGFITRVAAGEVAARAYGPVVLWLGAAAGFLVQLTILVKAQERAEAERRDQALRNENARKERERESAERALEAERQSLRQEQQMAEARREAARLALRRSMLSAQESAFALPVLLGHVEMSLERAQGELDARRPSPFWEAMEEAAHSLAKFDGEVNSIIDRRNGYEAQATQLVGSVPAFSLAVDALPNPAPTCRRLKELYNAAQADPHYFALVYEQRRTTSILIAGFRSLGTAIEHLGQQIDDRLVQLTASVECGLSQLESALASAARASGEQAAALRAEVKSQGSAISEQLQRDAEVRVRGQEDALRMLDNLQRGRGPGAWERDRRLP